MSLKLFCQAMIKVTLGFVLMAGLIFLPAGTLRYPNGWLLMLILFVPMFIAGLIMMFKAPALLERRLRSKEKLKEQGLVIKLSALMFMAGFVVAGLNFRFGWHILPKPVCVMGTVIFILGYALYGEVIRENSYLSRVIEVQEGQKVVDTGLYGIVRHPMYFATLLLFLSMPIILGSLHAFVIFLAYPFIIVKRLRSEEKLLEKELVGYKEYMTKVKYRLIPFIW